MKLTNQFRTLGQTLAFAGAILCVVCVLATQPASAGTEPYASKDKTVEMAPAEFNWTGLYIGLNGGGNWTDYDFHGFNTDVDLGQQANLIVDDFDLFTDGAFFQTPGWDDPSDGSIIGGGQLGYQYQWGHFVFGVEGDFQGLTSSATHFFQTDTSFGFVDEAFNTDTNLQTWRKIDNNWQASARAKLGYARGRVMLYVTGGGVWQDSTFHAKDVAATNFFDGGDFVATIVSKSGSVDDGVVSGWTAGAGAEWAFTEIASLGFEYRHNGFGDQSYNVYDHHGPIYSENTKIDQDSDQVVFKINLLLGHVGH